MGSVQGAADGAGWAVAVRAVGEQEAAQAISVACAPRQTRTVPVEPAVTTTWF